MKILIVHNDYGEFSGEEAVVDRMIADGRRAGYEIETLRRSSKFARESFWGMAKGFFSGIWSFSGRHMMREALRTFRPDIVHIHNLYPFISPSVLPICKRAGVPVVMTVHNYRLICPTGLFLRDGKPCENCLRNGNERDCVRYNCEHNRFRSLGYALRNMVARRTRAYLDNVDYFCCLTDFQRRKLVAAGFDSSRIRVMPNYVKYEKAEETTPETEAWGSGYVCYVGRMSHEKGFDMYVEVARRHPEIPFRMAGRLRDDIRIDIPPNLQLCGQLSESRLSLFYEKAAFLVIPSRCYEGFPMILLEASTHGRCCVVPNHGPFPELITDPENGNVGGLLFTPLDTDDLERKITLLWNDHVLNKQLSAQASEICRKRFAKHKLNQEWDVFLNSVAKRQTANHDISAVTTP